MAYLLGFPYIHSFTRDINTTVSTWNLEAIPCFNRIAVKMLYLCRFNINLDFSTFDFRLGYFVFSLLGAVFFTFSQGSFFALNNIASVLFFDLHSLIHFFGYDGRMVFLS